MFSSTSSRLASVLPLTKAVLFEVPRTHSWWYSTVGFLSSPSLSSEHHSTRVTMPSSCVALVMSHSPCAVSSSPAVPPQDIFLGCCCCSVAKSHMTCDLMDYSTLGFPVLHCLPEFAQIHIHWVSDAFQPSHPLLPPSPLAFNLTQHQGFFQWIGSSHQVTKVLELQLQHQSFQRIFRVDFI